MNIEVIKCFDAIKIKINGLLHCWVYLPKFLGMQSWYDGTSKWCIEFTMEDNVIICEYDTIDMWSLILRELDKII